jgi:hypothetical protein
MEFAVTHDDSGYYTTFAVVFASEARVYFCGESEAYAQPAR